MKNITRTKPITSRISAVFIIGMCYENSRRFDQTFILHYHELVTQKDGQQKPHPQR